MVPDHKRPFGPVLRSKQPEAWDLRELAAYPLSWRANDRASNFCASTVCWGENPGSIQGYPTLPSWRACSYHDLCSADGQRVNWARCLPDLGSPPAVKVAGVDSPYRGYRAWFWAPKRRRHWGLRHGEWVLSCSGVACRWDFPNSKLGKTRARIGSPDLWNPAKTEMRSASPT